MNLLNDSTENQEEVPLARQRMQSNKNNTLRQATIQAMSNLLSANVDSGLMHSIGQYFMCFSLFFNNFPKLALSQHFCSYVSDLGYNRDLQTRAAFMEVLTKILQQGTEFNTLAETVLADRFEQLVQLVTMISDKGELPIAMALANVVTTSQMVRVSPHFFVSNRGGKMIYCVEISQFLLLVV